ncbi:roadblock/LC7 domain-containing protein [Myxococcota bacterium]|nr:roadblock/LC7 domain-containing protein [Myxococcota bacterium]
MGSHWVVQEEDSRCIQALIDRLVVDAHGRSVHIVDKTGQLICQSGDTQGVDGTSLASLAAGCVAATGGLARLFGEDEFPSHFHQGRRDNLHISLVGSRMILMVVFDESSSLGLVRLRVKRVGNQLARIFEEAQKRNEAESTQNGNLFADITDEDIDNLFSD